MSNSNSNHSMEKLKENENDLTSDTLLAQSINSMNIKDKEKSNDINNNNNQDDITKTGMMTENSIEWKEKRPLRMTALSSETSLTTSSAITATSSASNSTPISPTRNEHLSMTPGLTVDVGTSSGFTRLPPLRPTISRLTLDDNILLFGGSTSHNDRTGNVGLRNARTSSGGLLIENSGQTGMLMGLNGRPLRMARTGSTNSNSSALSPNQMVTSPSMIISRALSQEFSPNNNNGQFIFMNNNQNNNNFAQDNQENLQQARQLDFPFTNIGGGAMSTSDWLRQHFPPTAHLNNINVNTAIGEHIPEHHPNHPNNAIYSLDINSFISHSMVQGHRMLCKIIRRKHGFDALAPQYELFLEGPNNTRTFILAARKKRKSSHTAKYIISKNRFEFRKDKSKSTIIGSVHSNFFGTVFSVFEHLEIFNSQDGTSKTEKVEVASIVYEPNVFGLKGPRKMTLLLPGITREGDFVQVSFKDGQKILYDKYKQGNTEDILILHNKSPQWNEETESYVLNFNGRVTLASVKNFQIINDQDLDYIVMQFGRVGNDTFTMDFQYPLSAMQAFGIALSSFDPKLACE